MVQPIIPPNLRKKPRSAGDFYVEAGSRDRTVKNPTFLLAAGLITLAVAGALAQFVFIGLLGLVLLPVGFLLAASALLTGRASTEPSDPAMGSIMAAWVGVVLVALSAFRGGGLAFATALHRLHPGAIQAAPSEAAWLAGAVIALVGAALLSTGLRRYPDCSPDHPIGWFVAAAAVFPASATLFFLFSTRQPFTA